MNHYIFIATGNDTEQNGKERAEYRHEVLSDREEACLSATRLLRSFLSAGWEDIRVEVEEVTETILITILKEEQHDT